MVITFAIGRTDKEPPYSPWLLGERVSDLVATPLRLLVRLVNDGAGRQKLSFDAQRSVLVLSNDSYPAMTFDADFAVLDVGAYENEGDLRIFGDDGNVMIHLDGGPGDITLAGSGCPTRR